jgi:uncharacterized protein involved in outer membrane biogenesis
MKRKAKTTLVVILAILVVIGVALSQVLANLDSIVARVIEEQGSEATGTSVTVGGVSIDLRGGSGTISGLEVANPPGFSGRPAIAFDEIRVGIDPMAATSSPIAIREVTVTGARLLMEQSTAGNNLRTLQGALQQPAAPESAAEGRGVVIERFLLEDASLEVDIPQLDESRQASIGRIELTDIGRATNGATAGSVARQIMVPIIRAALESAAAEGIRKQLQQEVDEAKGKVSEELLDRLPSRDN